MEKVRGKFTCTKAETNGYGQEVAFWALYSDNKEDNQYAAATPSGQISMVVSNPEVMGFFIPGKQYYMDLIPVDNGTDSKT